MNHVKGGSGVTGRTGKGFESNLVEIYVNNYFDKPDDVILRSYPRRIQFCLSEDLFEVFSLYLPCGENETTSFLR